MGRGLSLADTQRAAVGGFTQDDGYVRGVAVDAQRFNGSLFDIPPVTVSRVNAYSGGVLARALPEGLRYLST